MQPGCRCRDRALCMREDGLIVGSITLVRRPADIGRQRHRTALLDRLIEHGAMEGEGERYFSALPFAFDGGVELAEKTDLTLVPEAHHVACRQAFGRLHESTPARAVDTLVQRCFDRRLYRAAADAAPT